MVLISPKFVKITVLKVILSHGIMNSTENAITDKILYCVPYLFDAVNRPHFLICIIII